MSESQARKNPWIIVAVVSVFIIVFCFIFFLLNGFGVSPPFYSAIMGLIAGAFVVFIIMALNGMLQGFSIKSPFFEMNFQLLKERIENVQTNVTESKREIGDQITGLTQNINSINNRIDNVMTSINISKQYTTVTVNTEPAKRVSPSEGIAKQEITKKEMKDLVITIPGTPGISINTEDVKRLAAQLSERLKKKPAKATEDKEEVSG